MRVLHVHSGNLFGGVEALMLTLVKQRSVYPDLEPHFALCFEGRFSDELSASGGSYYPIGNVRLSRLLSVKRARRNLSALLGAEKFDSVVVHSAWAQAIFGRVIRSFHLPLVFWIHDIPEGMSWPERWARWSRPPDFVICNSKYTAERLPRLFPKVSSRVVHCPVAPNSVTYSSDEIELTRSGFGTSDDAIVILQVSRMEPHKGHLIHLEGLASLRDLPNWVCWQVGDVQKPHEREYFERVKRTATQLGIADRVRFLGWQPDVQRLFAASDIYCQPNLYAEPFGLTFVEALYAGKPVIATALGGPKEIVDSSCGLLVAPEPPRIAEALRQLISDSALRTRLGDNGPLRAQRLCDPASQIRSLGEIFLSTGNGFN